VLAFVFPGQGAQTPGFLQPWLAEPGVTDRLTALSEAAGMDLIAHGVESDAETIRDTAVAQPLIVASGLATLPALLGPDRPAWTVAGAVAGHSVGELAASAAAGVLTETDATALVAVRGAAMAEAAAVQPTGMSAVLGGDPEEVSAKLATHGLTPANMNGSGQVVAAGTLEQLAALAADPPAKARIIPLKVAGAFHTTHMAPAVTALAERAATMTVSPARTRLLSNADGAVVTDGDEVRSRLVEQVRNPVRWDLCMETMRTLGVTAVLELPPAGTLVNMIKRALPGVATLAIKTPADLPAARALLEEHADVSDLQPSGGAS